jgi:hypothetical protein
MKCSYDPRELAGAPIGQFHCPNCGEMVIAGLPHPDYDMDAPTLARDLIDWLDAMIEYNEKEVIKYGQGSNEWNHIRAKTAVYNELMHKIIELTGDVNASTEKSG